MEHCAAEESAVAQCLHIKNATEAADILLAAKQLLATRQEKQDIQKKSLGTAGTTKEKAAEAGYISSLVDEAMSYAVAEKK